MDRVAQNRRRATWSFGPRSLGGDHSPAREGHDPCAPQSSRCSVESQTNMSVFKRRGRSVWWFEFEYRGRRYRESAGTRSRTLAVEIERKRRRDVEEAANGIRRNRNAAV